MIKNALNNANNVQCICKGVYRFYHFTYCCYAVCTKITWQLNSKTSQA